MAGHRTESNKFGHHGTSHIPSTSITTFHRSKCRTKRSGPSYGESVDAISNRNSPPTVIDGTYTLEGGQINVIARMNQPLSIGTMHTAHFQNTVNPMQSANNYQGMETQAYNPQMGQLVPPPIVTTPSPIFTEASITVVGVKTSPGSRCCALMTALLGACLIFPLFFMCCIWWKKIVHPLYSLAPEFYRAIGTFLARERHCRMLNLTVYDNSFNAQKARILYESLAGSSLTGFSFTNGVLACNYVQYEVDSFITNVSALKSLHFPTQIRWDDMIL